MENSVPLGVVEEITPITPIKRNRKTSELWNYFTELAGGHARCDLCDKLFSYRTSTSNLKKHMSCKHKDKKLTGLKRTAAGSGGLLDETDPHLTPGSVKRERLSESQRQLSLEKARNSITDFLSFNKSGYKQVDGEDTLSGNEEEGPSTMEAETPAACEEQAPTQPEKKNNEISSVAREITHSSKSVRPKREIRAPRYLNDYIEDEGPSEAVLAPEVSLSFRRGKLDAEFGALGSKWTGGAKRSELDEIDAFGMVIAGKLRKLDDRQRLFCERIINDALYKGALSQLTSLTDIVICITASN